MGAKDGQGIHASSLIQGQRCQRSLRSPRSAINRKRDQSKSNLTLGVEKVLLESQNRTVKTDPVCDSEKEFCVSEDQILMAQKIQISNVL